MAANPNTLTYQSFSRHRAATGAPAVADGAVSATFPIRRGDLLNCRGFETILWYPVLAGGIGPSVTVQPLVYDEDLDVFAVLANVGPFTDGQLQELTVLDRKIFLRIQAVAGNPTDITIRVAPGKPSRSAV